VSYLHLFIPCHVKEKSWARDLSMLVRIQDRQGTNRRGKGEKGAGYLGGG
jgi:hypothetical protein